MIQNNYLLNKNKRRNNNSNKILLTNKNIKNKIEITEKLKNKDGFQAILKGFFSNNNNKEVVVKIGDRNTLLKEYKIAELLKDIPGFIHYLTIINCKDNIQRYTDLEVYKKICSNNESNKNMFLLIMDYYDLGSFEKYDWNKDNILLFKSCLKQIIICLYISFIKYHFLHIDNHLDNVLLKKTDKKFIKYDFEEFSIDVECYGLEIIIMDFENSIISQGINTMYIEYFYKDIERILMEIKHTMNLNFSNLNEFIILVNQLTINKQLNNSNILQILSNIDNLEFININERIILSYENLLKKNGFL